MTLHVRLFYRKDDEQSEQAFKYLASLKSEIPHQVTEIDIDLDPDIQKKYDKLAPVIKTGPYTLQAPFNIDDVKLHLISAKDSKTRNEEDLGDEYKKEQEEKNNISKGERFSYWYAKHYLLVINLFLALYIGLPTLAPVLMKIGATAPAKLIYRVYKPTCHQLAFRSFFLFGDQAIYPREAAGIEGFETFNEVTGINERDIRSSQEFIGNESLGYKIAICERDIAIFGGMLLFGLGFWAADRKVKQIRFIWVIIIGFIPMGIDGFSQLLTEIPGFSLWAFRESTPFLRILTGTLLGIMLGWYGYPLFEETMAQTRTSLASKFFSIPDNDEDES